MKKIQLWDHEYEAEDCVFKILCNPVLPDFFYFQDIYERTQDELEKWICVPYVVTNDNSYTLWILDNQCHDRPTMHGVFQDISDAFEYLISNKILG